MEESKEMFEEYSADELYDLALEGGWEWPEPLGQQSELQEFPVYCLPDSLGQYVKAVSVATQTPPEMAGILSLGVLATLFQRRYTLEVRPGWTEPLSMFVAAVAGPGERKSSVMKAMTAPLYAYESRRRQSDRLETARQNARREVLQRRIEALKSGKAKRTPAEMEELDNLLDELDSTPEREPFRLLADDSTPEKLTDMLDRCGGCLTICSAEGGVFDNMSGRYDGGSGFDVYLKGHAGDAIAVDRIGRRGNMISEPRLSMMLTVQPEVISGIMSNRAMKGRGLCARFLYAWCPSFLGRRQSDPPPVPEDVHRAYSCTVVKALEAGESAVLHGDAEFNALRAQYQDGVERELLGEGLEEIRDWGGKLVGAVCRTAALFHCWQYPEDAGARPLGREELQRAIMLGDYLSASARRAYGVLNAGGVYNAAAYVWDKLHGSGKLCLSRSELRDLCRGRYNYSRDLKRPLAVLEELGYVRCISEFTSTRPRMVIQVNPLTRL